MKSELKQEQEEVSWEKMIHVRRNVLMDKR